jgi:hypothetical protein
MEVPSAALDPSLTDITKPSEPQTADMQTDDDHAHFMAQVNWANGADPAAVGSVPVDASLNLRPVRVIGDDITTTAQSGGETSDTYTAQGLEGMDDSANAASWQYGNYRPTAEAGWFNPHSAPYPSQYSQLYPQYFHNPMYNAYHPTAGLMGDSDHYYYFNQFSRPHTYPSYNDVAEDAAEPYTPEHEVESTYEETQDGAGEDLLAQTANTANRLDTEHERLTGGIAQLDNVRSQLQAALRRVQGSVPTAEALMPESEDVASLNDDLSSISEMPVPDSELAETEPAAAEEPIEAPVEQHVETSMDAETLPIEPEAELSRFAEEQLGGVSPSFLKKFKKMLATKRK